MEKMFEILTGCPLFRGLDAGQIEDILRSDDVISVSRFKKGDTIALHDTAYSGLMILLRGRASGTFTYPSGHTVRMEAIEAPQMIAPAFLFGGYNRLPIDVVAETETEMLTLHRGYLFDLMQDNTIILSNFIDIISNRAGVWQKKIYALSFRSLKEKLASYLLDHSDAETNIVPVPEIKETAEYFAATRSSLQAVIEGLEKKKIIKSDDGNILILNRNALKDLLK